MPSLSFVVSPPVEVRRTDHGEPTVSSSGQTYRHTSVPEQPTFGIWKRIEIFETSKPVHLDRQR